MEPLRNGYIRLTDGKRRHRAKGGWTTLNGKLAVRCTRQKEVTSALLRARGIATPENAVFSADDANRAWTWAEPIAPVVVKPHAGAKGNLVHIGVNDAQDFTEAFDRVAARYGRVLVEQFVTGTEMRFGVVRGEVLAVAERRPPEVIGDGVTSIEELVARKNAHRREVGNPVHTDLTIDPIVSRTLERQGLSFESVPASGHAVLLRETSNVSLGGEAIDRTETTRPDHVEMVQDAVRAIPGLRLAGVDVLIDGADAHILEINDGPMLRLHWFPWRGQQRDLYSPVLDLLFPATASPVASAG